VNEKKGRSTYHFLHLSSLLLLLAKQTTLLLLLANLLLIFLILDLSLIIESSSTCCCQYKERNEWEASPSSPAAFNALQTTIPDLFGVEVVDRHSDKAALGTVARLEELEIFVNRDCLKDLLHVDAASCYDGSALPVAVFLFSAEEDAELAGAVEAFQSELFFPVDGAVFNFLIACLFLDCSSTAADLDCKMGCRF
jgi:hypothetical protein